MGENWRKVREWEAGRRESEREKYGWRRVGKWEESESWRRGREC